MKEKLTCYIIDDEYLAQEILETYIAKVAFLQLKGTFSSPLEAAEKMDKDRPDLLFLDINMPDLDGLSFIPMLNPKPLIIITTAYDQYALKGFELAVQDYLVKPFPFERFYQSVLRLYRKQDSHLPVERQETIAEQQPEPDHLFVKVGHRIQKIAARDILYVEGMKDYLRIHTVHEKIMTLASFAKLEALLPASAFSRVHKSFIVAIDKIEHIEKNRIQIADRLIPISKTYANEFYKKLRGLV